MINVCLAVIAACEVVRIVQLELSIRRERKAKEDIYGEFIKSLKASDREWVRSVLEEYERQEGGESE